MFFPWNHISTHFWSVFPFYTPRKHQKAYIFLCFQGVYYKNIDQKRVNATTSCLALNQYLLKLKSDLLPVFRKLLNFQRILFAIVYEKLSFMKYIANPLMHNISKWSDTLQKSCSICCKIFKVCLIILGHHALNGWELYQAVVLFRVTAV